MKRSQYNIFWILFSFLFVVTGMIMAACNTNKDHSINPLVDLSQSEFYFPENGGSDFLDIKTNIFLEVSCADEWCKLIETEHSTSDILQFEILVDPNDEDLERQTKIAILGDQYYTELNVRQQEKQTPAISSEILNFIEALGMGWNLGNQLDAHRNGIANETIWGNKVTTQAAFNKIAAIGINSIRIPVTWLGKIGPAPDYIIDGDWLDRVAEVVDYAENAGLNAIINIHHDGANSKYWLNIKDAAINSEINMQIKAQLYALWSQIAEKFYDKGDFLIFEGMNEIHDGKWGWGANLSDGGKQYAVLNEWNQVFVDAIRSVGGKNLNRYLGISGYCANPDLTLQHMKLPLDPTNNRLLVSVHYYDPHKYAIEGEFSEWGHTASKQNKDDYGDEEHVREIFRKLKIEYIDNGIPVYIGEMGSVNRDTELAEKFRKYYLEYICKAANTYGLVPFYWDNGSSETGREAFGLINHTTGAFIKNGGEIIELMINAVTNDDPDYTLDSVYKKAP